MIDWATVGQTEVFDEIASHENTAHVLEVMSRLTCDPNWTAVITDLVSARRIETRCFMAWLSKTLQPRDYLEIGVRRGFSMSMVVSRTPSVNTYGFDMWMPAYAGSDNPGSDFVATELRKLGQTGIARFVAGNSHETIPAFFGDGRSGLRSRFRVRRAAGQPPQSFDLMLVDGDHSLLGAHQDLMDTLPHVGVGGVLVFDDVAPDPAHVDPEATRQEQGPDPHGWGDLMGVWRAAMTQFPGFRSFEYSSNTPGVAFGVRLR